MRANLNEFVFRDIIGLGMFLDLNQLKNTAFIDHYLDTTAKNSKIIIIRYLGSRSEWSYGFEQFYNWSKSKSGRTLIILSGTDEQIIELNNIKANKKLNITPPEVNQTFSNIVFDIYSSGFPL